MKKIKTNKILSLLLAVIMAIGMLPMSATTVSAVKETSRLAAPTNLRWDRYTLQWDAVEGASSYSYKLFYLNESGKQVHKSESSAFTQTSYDFNSEVIWRTKDYGTGDFIVGIKAISEDKQSTYAYAAVKFTAIPHDFSEAPENLRWTGNRLEWDMDSEQSFIYDLDYVYIDANDNVSIGLADQLISWPGKTVGESMEEVYRKYGEGSFMIRIETAIPYTHNRGKYVYSPSVDLPMILTDIKVQNEMALNSSGCMDPNKFLYYYNYKKVSVDDYGTGIYTSTIATAWEKDGSPIADSTGTRSGDVYTAEITLTASGGFRLDPNCKIRYGDGLYDWWRPAISEDNKVATVRNELRVYCPHTGAEEGYIRDADFHWRYCPDCRDKFDREPHDLIIHNIDGTNQYVECSTCDYAYEFQVEKPVSSVGITLAEPVAGKTLSRNVYVNSNGCRLAKTGIVWYESSTKPASFTDCLTKPGTYTRLSDGATFKVGKQYTAAVYLEPKEGYRWNDISKLTAKINGVDASVHTAYIENGDSHSQLVAYYTFGPLVAKTEVTSINIVGVQAPVYGEANSHEWTLLGDDCEKVEWEANYETCGWWRGNSQMTNQNEVWNYGEQENAGTKFENCYYTFSAYLKPKAGYTMASNVAVTINGEPGFMIEYDAYYDRYLVCRDFGLCSPRITLSGTVQSFGEPAESTYVKLYENGADADSDMNIITGNNGNYSFANISAGTYRLEVSKKNHVTREYTITIPATGTATQDVGILLVGDVTGDGRVNATDHSRLYAHINNKKPLTDSYALKCADVTGEGKVNATDHSRLYAHINNKKPLF